MKKKCRKREGNVKRTWGGNEEKVKQRERTRKEKVTKREGSSAAAGSNSRRLCPPLQIESTQAESQWIVEQVYSQHLQYLEAIKSSAKDLSLPIFEIAIDLTVRMKLGRSLYVSCNKGRGV